MASQIALTARQKVKKQNQTQHIFFKGNARNKLKVKCFK